MQANNERARVDEERGRVKIVWVYYILADTDHGALHKLQ